QRPVRLEGDRVTHEPNRTVTHRELQPAGMAAAEGVPGGPVPFTGDAEVRVPNGVSRVRGDGTGPDGPVRISPGVPLNERRQVLADHERVTESIGDAREGHLAGANVGPPKDAIAPFQSVLLPRRTRNRVPVRCTEADVRSHAIEISSPVGSAHAFV